MPIFDYRCNDCKESFEVFTLSKNCDNISCKFCKSQRVHRVISPVGIIFKGSGFYINDSKKDSSGESKKEPVNA